MSFDLTPCGHLRGVHCDKCRPASQKQGPLTDEQAAKLMVSAITPLIEAWFKAGQITANQAAANLLGMSAAIAIQIGMTKEQFMMSANTMMTVTEGIPQ